MAAVQPPAGYGQAQNTECLLYGLTLYGPYEEHVGTYHLRLYVTFIQHPDSAQWITQQQADASAAVTFQVLNGAYNQHGIYFINPGASCPATATIISSSEISGQALLNAMPGAKHDDGNYFHYDEETVPKDSLIGVECIRLGEGLNNQIKGNIYENMFVAHRAVGDNGFSEDGLVYLCDSMVLTYPDIPEEIEIKDFQVKPGGTIRREQQDDNSPGDPLPTGNIFSIIRRPVWAVRYPLGRNSRTLRAG